MSKIDLTKQIAGVCLLLTAIGLAIHATHLAMNGHFQTALSEAVGAFIVAICGRILWETHRLSKLEADS